MSAGRRQRRPGLGRLGLIMLAPAVLMALTAELWSSSVAGFTYDEMHTGMVMAAPGERDVPLQHRSYDGLKTSFTQLDLNGDGLLSLAPGGELQTASRSFRACLFAMARARREGGARLVDLPPACPIPADVRPGIRTIGDLVEASRWTRHRSAALAAFDANSDGAIDRNEYPGAPLTRPFLLGTDASGRDLGVRLFYGIRASMLVALLAAAVSVLLGGLAGLLAGSRGGLVDALILRIADVLYGLPLLFVVMLLYLAVRRLFADSGLSPGSSSLLQAGILFMALGAIQWPPVARLARGATLDLKSTGFVRGAHAMGLPGGAVLRLHLLPHLAPVLLAYGLLLVPVLMLEEAFLSFLGFGIQPPYPSLGTLIRQGLAIADVSPVAALAPLTLLTLTGLGLQLIARGCEVRRP